MSMNREELYHQVSARVKELREEAELLKDSPWRVLSLQMFDDTLRTNEALLILLKMDMPIVFRRKMDDRTFMQYPATRVIMDMN